MNEFDPVGFILMAAIVVGVVAWYFKKRPQDQAKVEAKLKELEDKVKDELK